MITKRISTRMNKGKAPEHYNNITWGNLALEDDDDMGYTLTALGQEEQIKGHDIHIPSNYKEAINSPQKVKWQEAMEHQFNKLIAKGIWVLQPCLHGVRLLPGKWVFDLKIDANGFVVEYRV